MEIQKVKTIIVLKLLISRLVVDTGFWARVAGHRFPRTANRAHPRQVREIHGTRSPTRTAPGQISGNCGIQALDDATVTEILGAGRYLQPGKLATLRDWSAGKDLVQVLQSAPTVKTLFKRVMELTKINVLL